MRIGSYCEKHLLWSESGVCPDCVPEPRTLAEMAKAPGLKLEAKTTAPSSLRVEMDPPISPLDAAGRQNDVVVWDSADGSRDVMSVHASGRVDFHERYPAWRLANVDRAPAQPAESIFDRIMRVYRQLENQRFVFVPQWHLGPAEMKHNELTDGPAYVTHFAQEIHQGLLRDCEQCRIVPASK